ncbi:3-phosphoshikimate 1-carboxyvinyltransferase [Treponema sp.]|uniref:3-phosphoshikimate 1-carboxyvinyltransferase n=1 Tax=Treponema sp. TaxID=166 RepID=UPI00298E76E3|nr:3-phosphoshikimate 1-carboxyvinyltransferase [Treponema sp.]MCQ2240676.1 3-phosphoshikimate 1-carboxyvinyltransferase [Treponema sp.]
MKINAFKNKLSGHIQVPGSKSHTIRALLLASLAEGTSHISNPLPSADCLSTSKAIPLIGAELENDLATMENDKVWTVKGAGNKVHLPTNVIDVGNSGSLLYFLSPIAATFEGWSIFTGDESIRKRPVAHVVDVLNQLGAEAHISQPGATTCPMLIKGPIDCKAKVVTDGAVSSQYISGLMMSAIRMNGTLKIELSDPKETPYLTMTQKWLEQVGVNCRISEDFKHIEVDGPVNLKAFDTTIPSDWEAVAFPLMAGLITDSEITIDNIDIGGTQGDDAIVDILQSVGGDITVDREKKCLVVRGGKRLTTENLPGKELHVKISGFPDAICALAATACFIEGTTVIEDAEVCRRKETDRIKVLKSELEKLGAVVEEGPDYMIIHGHSPMNADRTKNPEFKMHGGEVDSYLDHRIAMSMACLGLGLADGETVTIKDAECCSVSFPHFFDVMNQIGAGFKEA